MQRSHVEPVAAPPVRGAQEQEAALSAPFPRLLAWLLTVGGLAAFAAAFTLSVEKIALLKNPAYVPSCSLNPVLSCGSVMNTPQAEAFGFANPLLGVAGFAVVTAIGVVLLTAAALPRWFWLGLQVGVTFGVVFVHWLIYQSLYVIGALCPYCMVVWAAVIPIFWYVTLHNLQQRHLPAARAGRTGRALQTVLGYHTVPLTLWFLAVITAIGVRFWSYWSTLL
ncbi:vitamin K epoxide reductase family protein [Nonomuraea wenchangensis]|uniref:vitamin K epoxide reductase family protein n=1 Tax=Nonomuraea wenchangensis TaxID=568860 RepID=UPI00342F32D5